MRPKDNAYRLRAVCSFALPGLGGLLFGDRPVNAISAGDIESFRHARRAAGLSAVTVNHDLKLLRKMFAWGVRERMLPATPFKIGTETAIKLDPETPRERRFRSDDEEEKVLTAANPHLRAVIIAMLDTCCRPGELLSLQWVDVDIAGRQFTVRAEKAKTRRDRRVPISSRLQAVLEMRKLDPAGEPFGPRHSCLGTSWGNRFGPFALHGATLLEKRVFEIFTLPTCATKQPHGLRKPGSRRPTCRSSWDTGV